MKVRYPKFLSKTPSFFGFDMIDLALVGASLFISSLFELNSIISLILTALLILARKIIVNRIDISGETLRYYKFKQMDLSEHFRNGEQG